MSKKGLADKGKRKRQGEQKSRLENHSTDWISYESRKKQEIRPKSFLGPRSRRVKKDWGDYGTSS